jgi:hypothetical protein
MKLSLPANVTRALGKTKFKLRKNSPEILIIAGGIGAVASTVLACKATLKVDQVLEEHEVTTAKIKYAHENPEECKAEYSEQDYKKDLAIAYLQTGVKIAKLYAPAVILGGLSLTSIFTSHSIIRKRNIALSAAYATLESGMAAYRKNVVAELGEDADRRFRYGLKSEEITVTETDENGKTKKVKKKVEVVDPEASVSDFARYYNDSCKEWVSDPEYNLTFLKLRQSEANERLKIDGYLFLNDVYDMLGIPRTKAGQIVGWRYDPSNPDGDNYVDFGIYEALKRNEDFVNGYENTILLDFNVDGNIWEKM